ncbi:hypothetical protein AJ79_05916 [Helicocarpus griseus UAMH5409]|uniref:MARVEL domain-containing protein n=1 Tax=Helicocarpus griseus UAMH5409 TaxID=1447875 RepID=A0A2B7XIG8_9EURO|nr:hypothetical protein AJ79_05916 [Helicocarpus griseus UAMH5409]
MEFDLSNTLIQSADRRTPPQLIWAIIAMALIGNMMETAYGSAGGTVNYAMFPPAFAMAVILWAFLIQWVPSAVIHPALLFVVDLLVTLSTFATAVALPAKLHAKDCSNLDYTSTNEVTRDRADLEEGCREAQAATAFLWFLWATFLGSTIMSGLWMTEEIRGAMGGGPPPLTEKRRAVSGTYPRPQSGVDPSRTGQV